MYIINDHGILNGWPDEWKLPAKHRLAEQWEIDAFKATGQQDTAKMSKPKPAAKAKKDDNQSAE